MAGTRACLVTALALWMPAAAGAQEVAASLEELALGRNLSVGHGVYVTDDTGRRIKGNVSNLSASALKIRTRNGTRTLKADAIHRIERQDPLGSGIFLGLGAGIAGLMVSCRMEAGGDTCYGTLYAFLPVMAGSAVLGAIVDASTHRTIYQTPGATRLTLSPAISDRHLGLRASVSW